MIKLAVFDLDGTLLNTLNSIAHFGNTALEKYGLPTVDISEFPQFIGNGAPVLIEKLYKFVNGDPEKYDEFFKDALEIYNELGNKNIFPYEEIDVMLDGLKQKGIKCAVLSNKPHNITTEVCKNFFDGKFECVYGHRPEIAKKPDPYMLNKIISDMGVNNNECIFCGDSTVDVETGKNANVSVFGAAWGFYGDKPFEKADKILYKPTDIFNYI